MRYPDSQKGYALLMMLAGLGAISLGFIFTSSLAIKSHWYSLTQDAFQLKNERARLMYYAVDYAKLYGSGGAGPGHLPCPDTDGGTQRPGPNPPCGGAALAIGKLPDGVTRTVGRIALTDSLINRSAYTLARALVNNPSLPINTMRWPDEIPFESSMDGYASLSRPSGQARVLTRKQIEKPSLQWVRAWLSWQLLENALSYCDKEKVPFQNELNFRVISLCSKETSTDEIATEFSAVESTIIGVVSNTNTDSDSDSNTDSVYSNSSVIEPCSKDTSLCTFSEYEALHWISNGESEQWQNTRLSNHWFVKNHWLELFTVQAQISCLNRTEDCVLYLDETEQTLRFRLLVSVVREDDV